MSFNIRYGTAPDGEHAWQNRRPLVIDLLRREGCDFIGCQEALRFQLDDIVHALPQYAEVGVGRDDGRTRGEYSAILFRADRWTVERCATVWLSPQPHQPGSTGWGNRIPRIATYGRFVHKLTGTAVWLFNTHWDHQSQSARQHSAKFLAELIDQRPHQDCVIVTGDFNAEPTNEAILSLMSPTTMQGERLKDTFYVTESMTTQVGTFHAFRGRRDGPRIDYVLVSPQVEVRHFQILYDERNGIYPSDHFPVVAHLLISTERRE